MAQEAAPPPAAAPRHPTNLRRDARALDADRVTSPRAPRRAAAPTNKDDPNHPLRGGKERTRKWAPRPSRKKGTQPWLARQLDRSGVQERTLRIAFDMFHHKPTRIALCGHLRMTRTQNVHLPLKPQKGKVCTATVCHCLPYFRILVGMDGGMGDGTPTFVSDLFALWKSEQKKAGGAA